MTIDPVLIAYAVERRKGAQRAFWQRIGAAYPHDDGAGLTVLLDVVPRDGRIVLLELDADDDRRLERRARSYASQKACRQRRQG